LDNKITDLKKEYKNLQVKEAYLRSMPRVEAGINCLDMKVVDSDEYFDLAKLMMAKR
jgi:cell division protein FtsL